MGLKFRVWVWGLACAVVVFLVRGGPEPGVASESSVGGCRSLRWPAGGRPALLMMTIIVTVGDDYHDYYSCACYHCHYYYCLLLLHLFVHYVEYSWWFHLA